MMALIAIKPFVMNGAPLACIARGFSFNGTQMGTIAKMPQNSPF